MGSSVTYDMRERVMDGFDEHVTLELLQKMNYDDIAS